MMLLPRRSIICSIVLFPYARTFSSRKWCWNARKFHLLKGHRLINQEAPDKKLVYLLILSGQNQLTWEPSLSYTSLYSMCFWLYRCRVGCIWKIVPWCPSRNACESMLCIRCSCRLSPNEDIPWRWVIIKLLFAGLNPITAPGFVRLESYVARTTTSVSKFCGDCMIKFDFSGEREGLSFSGEGDLVSSRLTVVISCMLDLLLSFPPESCLIKYFWAWLATWVGVLVVTKLREIFRQSPFPYFFSPNRNSLRVQHQHKHIITNSKEKG